MIDALKLALLIGATLAGTLFSLWRNGQTGNWFGGLLLLGISTLLARTGDHPLGVTSPPVVLGALALGLCFGLTFPCCTPNPRIGFWQMAGGLILFLHCLLDGHIVREATSIPLIALLGVHKFLDGADARILSRENRSQTFAARIALILATPIGFLFIPEGIINPTLHASLFAAIIGLNVGSAFHLFRHAVAHHGHEHAHAHVHE